MTARRTLLGTSDDWICISSLVDMVKEIEMSWSIRGERHYEWLGRDALLLRVLFRVMCGKFGDFSCIGSDEEAENWYSLQTYKMDRCQTFFFIRKAH